MLEIKDLKVSIEDKKILKGLNFTAESGKVYAIMGPNGAGKSTLSKAISGDPSYDVEGQILVNGKEISEMDPDERAKEGVFLSFQYPIEIPGLLFIDFLHAAYTSIHGEVEMKSFRNKVEEIADQMVDPD